METPEITKSISLSYKQIDLIAHSLGINYYNAKLSDEYRHKVLPDDFYRNYFCVGDPNQFTDEMRSMEEAGLIETWSKPDNFFFAVTEKGIEEFRLIFKTEVTDKYVPLSKAKQRYRQYLHDDISDSFSESLGIQKPKREQDRNGFWRFVSTKYDNVKGEFCKTIKEAKESYKEALKKSKTN